MWSYVSLYTCSCCMRVCILRDVHVSVSESVWTCLRASLAVYEAVSHKTLLSNRGKWYGIIFSQVPWPPTPFHVVWSSVVGICGR